MSAVRVRPMPAPALASIADPCLGCGYIRPVSLATERRRGAAGAVAAHVDQRRSGRNVRRSPRNGQNEHSSSKPLRATEAEWRHPGAPEWAIEVADLWGMCGMAAHLDEATAGYLTVAPAELAPDLLLPGWAGRTIERVSDDAAVILDIGVCANYRGQHIGRNLVRGAAAQLVKRHVGTIEVIATSGPPVRLVPGRGSLGTAGVDTEGTDHPLVTLLPAHFWRAIGFRTVRPHPVAPTLRLDLANTERWIPDFAAAWQRFAELLSQPAPPRPAGFQENCPVRSERADGR